MKHNIDPDEISNELSGLNELLEIIRAETGNADFSKNAISQEVENNGKR